jgi:hypothetical protein
MSRQDESLWWGVLNALPHFEVAVARHARGWGRCNLGWSEGEFYFQVSGLKGGVRA